MFDAFPKTVESFISPSKPRTPSTSAFSMSARELRVIQRGLKKARDEASRLTEEVKVARESEETKIKSQELHEATKQLAVLQMKLQHKEKKLVNASKKIASMRQKIEKRDQSIAFWHKQVDRYSALLKSLTRPFETPSSRKSFNGELLISALCSCLCLSVSLSLSFFFFLSYRILFLRSRQARHDGKRTRGPPFLLSVFSALLRSL